MASSVSNKKPSDEQVAHLKGTLEVAIRQSGQNFHQIQRMIEREGVVKDDLIELCRKYGLPILPYPNQVAKRSLGYGDVQPADIETQRSRLLVVHNGIDLSCVSQLLESVGPRPMGADCIALRPKLSYLGKRFGGVADPYVDYGESLLEKGLFPILAGERDFHNYRAGKMSSKYLQFHGKVLERYRAMDEATPGDVNVGWVSLGINPYAPDYNWSPDNFRPICLEEGDLPLGSVDICGMLITVIPERLTLDSHLRLDCSAEKYAWRADGDWTGCPYFRRYDGQLEFSARYSGLARGHFGSGAAVGSVPGK